MTSRRPSNSCATPRSAQRNWLDNASRDAPAARRPVAPAGRGTVSGSPLTRTCGSDGRSALRDWRSRGPHPFFVYSAERIATEPEREVDRLCENAVGGQERIVDLVMQRRARPAAMAEGGL